MQVPAANSDLGILPIRRTIPGSNFVVFFSLKIIDNAPYFTAIIHTETLAIPNVPIHFFSKNSSQKISLEEGLKRLRTRAIDYVRGAIILLAKGSSHLIAKWEKQKTTINRDEQENPQTYIFKLEELGKLLKATASATTEAVDACHSFGMEYYCSCKYKKALFFFQEMFKMADSIHDDDGLRLAHRHLGMVYQDLGESDRALSHHKNELRFDLSLEEKRKAYFSIGNIYSIRGKNNIAKEWYEKFLSACEELNMDLELAYSSLGNAFLGLSDFNLAKYFFKKSLDIAETAEALNGLGEVCEGLGYYKDAIQYYQEALKQNPNRVNQGAIHANLSSAYQRLGQNLQAEEHRKIDLQIASDTGNCESEARAYYNLAQLCVAQEAFTEGLEYLKKVIPLKNCLKDHDLQGKVYSLFGHCYFGIENYKDSIKSHKEHLNIASKLDDLAGQINAYSNLGKTYTFSKKYSKAIQNFNQALALARIIQDKEAVAIVYSNLGRVHYYCKDLERAIDNFYLSIHSFKELHQINCRENLQWKISLFEKQFIPFRSLEKAFLIKGEPEAALMTADSSRAKALISLLEGKIPLGVGKGISLDEIKNIAFRLQTILVVYSCDPFDDEKAWCWVISATQVTHHSLILPEMTAETEADPKAKERFFSNNEELRGTKLQGNISKWIAETEKEACRGSEEVSSSYLLSNPQKLREWYHVFIAPIEQLLPQNGARVTIVPDSFLHDLPFALFQDNEGSYLFEKCTLFTAPSLEVLLSLEKFEQSRSSEKHNLCIIKNSKSNENLGLPKLKGVEEEAASIAEYYKNFHQCKPVIESIKTNIVKASHIHIACHGLADEQENAHSVFKGALVMEDRLLYTEDIVNLPLHAKLAFLSACSSGKAKVYREGSVGLPFAFLAGGVPSVIATRWQVYDKAAPQIAEEFYRHYLGQSEEAKQALAEERPFGQAEALRAAMLFAKAKWPDKPHVWGSFFLTGLPGNIEIKETVDAQSEEWLVEESGLSFSLNLGENILIVKDQKGKVFSESKIEVHMTDFAQLKFGVPQNKLLLNCLSLEDKKELVLSLSKRKIFVKENSVTIGCLKK